MNPEIQQILQSKGCYNRINPDLVDLAVDRMGIGRDRKIVDFYRHFEGPFCSDYTGVILSDLVLGPKSSIEVLTARCRKRHELPSECIVIGDLCGDSITVYNWKTDKVYDVDFEGGLDQLKEGTLEPQCTSFEAFLDFYFLGIGAA